MAGVILPFVMPMTPFAEEFLAYTAGTEIAEGFQTVRAGAIALRDAVESGTATYSEAMKIIKGGTRAYKVEEAMEHIIHHNDSPHAGDKRKFDDISPDTPITRVNYRHGRHHALQPFTPIVTCRR